MNVIAPSPTSLAPTTKSPTAAPTNVPTPAPTGVPSQPPTRAPTDIPTPGPTVNILALYYNTHHKHTTINVTKKIKK